MDKQEKREYNLFFQELIEMSVTKFNKLLDIEMIDTGESTYSIGDLLFMIQNKVELQ